jgi:hypothetical protein
MYCCYLLHKVNVVKYIIAIAHVFVKGDVRRSPVSELTRWLLVWFSMYLYANCQLIINASFQTKYTLTVCDTPDDKETIHCEFDISGSDLTWTSGNVHA